MTTPSEALTVLGIRNALEGLQDPGLGHSIVKLNMVRDVQIDGTQVSLRLVMTRHDASLSQTLAKDITTKLRGLGASTVAVHEDVEVVAHRPQGKDDRLPGVRAVVAVASGKGGVGKSTVAANLAVSLAAQGAAVGLIDADIYGPSQPTMLGLTDARPTMTDDPNNPKIIPMRRHGVQVMSMGFMLEADQAVVWRGPMLGKALQQFIDDVQWGPLDYLVIDMPPGTGDVQLSLAQLLPVSGTVVVTTPQDVAFADVRRAIKMLNLTKSPILGLVENMSHFECDACGKRHLLFGPSRIAGHAEEHDLSLLASIPLDTVTALAGDKGEPIAAQPAATEQKNAYEALATSVTTELTRAALKLGQPMTSKFRAFFDMKPD